MMGVNLLKCFDAYLALKEDESGNAFSEPLQLITGQEISFID
jgi:hypothetical protein